MPRNLSASDRSSLIRLASRLPAGSPQRKAILAGLSKTAAVKGDLYFEGGDGEKRTLWKKGVTPDQAKKMISDWEKKFEVWEAGGMKGKPPGPMVEGGTPVFVAEDGNEMMYTDTWEKMASPSASQIAKQIAAEFAEDNGFPKGTRFPLAKIERAVAKMLADGAVLDAEGITTLAAGDYDDREARYGQYEGYVEIDEILNSLM